jgi:hypothetical protein
MFVIWNITYKTPQGSCHIKDTNFCNEEKKKKNKPSKQSYLTKRPNQK